MYTFLVENVVQHFAESIAIYGISSLKGPQGPCNPASASQDKNISDGHLCQSLLIRRWRMHKNLSGY